MAWVYLDSVSSSEKHILAKGSSTDQYILYLDGATTNIAFAIGVNNTLADYRRITNNAAITTNTWYFVVAKNVFEAGVTTNLSLTVTGGGDLVDAIAQRRHLVDAAERAIPQGDYRGRAGH